MNLLKLNKTIEYIKQFECSFDCLDVEDSVDIILCSYDVFENFNGEEKEILKQELMKIAEQAEFAEAARYQENYTDLPEKKDDRTTLRQLIIERKVLLAQVKGC